jgi:hypothetical protein
MTLWFEYKQIGKVGITIQGSNAFDDISVENVKCFASNNDLFTFELWSSRKVLVTYLIKLFGIFE